MITTFPRVGIWYSPNKSVTTSGAITDPELRLGLADPVVPPIEPVVPPFEPVVPPLEAVVTPVEPEVGSEPSETF